MPKLSDLLGERTPRDVAITGLSADSRSVRPGYLFAALPGTRQDGRNFIPQALEKGAVAVLSLPGTPLAEDAILVADPEPRRRFALMAARFFAHQPETMAAVTGTNGKTSAVNFLRQIWASLGYRAASLGTIGLIAPGRVEKGSMTTPDPASLHQTLAELAQEGVTHAAFEASSHGLDQFRLDGVHIRAAGFTNLTRDHLDYHGDMERYWQAKRRLFTEILDSDGAAVINADTPEAEPLSALCRARGQRVLTYGAKGEAIRLVKREVTAASQILSLSLAGRAHRVELPLAGAFQAANALCALGLALGAGAEEAPAVAALAKLEGVPGRLQKVASTAKGADIYVDYAHTPDALETVLKALRPHAKGRLWLVFGCGGDRDPGKRPMMGRIAATLADRVIVTDDNPRGEEPALIRSAILAACPGAVEIGDRAAAIRAGVAGLEMGDILLLAGKGHETGQIVKDRVLPFDDAEQARAAVEDRP